MMMRIIAVTVRSDNDDFYLDLYLQCPPVLRECTMDEREEIPGGEIIFLVSNCGVGDTSIPYSGSHPAGKSAHPEIPEVKF